MIKKYCDRCGKECKDYTDSKGFFFFRRKYFVKHFEDAYLDLCQDCYASLDRWMRKKDD